MKRILLFLIASISVMSCEKDVEVPNWSQDPVFWINSEMDGMAHSLQAGIDDYYLHAGFKDSASLPREFYGFLCVQGCPTCPDNIKLRLRNYVVGGLFNPDSSFALGAHPFLEPYAPQQPNSRIYEFNAFIDSSEGPPVQVYWDFGDGQTSTDVNPTHVYDLTSAPTIATCSLYVAYQSGCSASSYQNIVLNSSCYGNFSADVSGYSVQFQPNVQASGQVTYDWEFGDGYYSNEISPSHTYSSSGTFDAKLTVTDQSSGCSSMYRHKVRIGQSNCLVNCHYEPKNVQVNNDWIQAKHMAIDYHDAHGQLWSSAFGWQPDSSSIMIDHMEPYLLNEQGAPTYHIEGTINCLLFLPDLSDTIVLEQGSYSFALAH